MDDIVFFGSADFCLPTLKILANHYKVRVVTKPPKPSGRGLAISLNPVAKFAKDNGLEIKTPTKLNQPDFLKWLKAKNPLLNIVIAYGGKLPPAVLGIAPSINFHGSILPRWQGASPIHQAILNGDTKTGVTAILMNEEIDKGDIINIAETNITPEDDFTSLYKKLSQLCGTMALAVLEGFLANTHKPHPQPTAGRTFAPLIKTADTFLDWSEPAEKLALKVRAFSSYPAARCILKQREIKVLKAKELPKLSGKAGEIAEENLAVYCGSGALELQVVKPQGKNKMSFAELLRGWRY